MSLLSFVVDYDNVLRKVKQLIVRLYVYTTQSPPYHFCTMSALSVVPAQLEFAFVYSSHYVAEMAAAEDGSTGWWSWLPEVTWTQVY